MLISYISLIPMGLGRNNRPIVRRLPLSHFYAPRSPEEVQRIKSASRETWLIDAAMVGEDFLISALTAVFIS